MSNKFITFVEDLVNAIIFSFGGLMISQLLIWSKDKSSMVGFDGLDSPFTTSVD